MDDIDVTDSMQPDRRSILKKAGIVGVGIWAAPVVTSITSPAFAQGSPLSTGRGCTPLAGRSIVSATIMAKAASNHLEFGLEGLGSVCTDCSGGETQNFGEFDGDTELVFYLTDHGNGCGGLPCNVTYLCSNAAQATVYAIPGGYDIYFADAYCDCNGTIGTPPFGPPTNFNLYIRVTITPVV